VVRNPSDKHVTTFYGGMSYFHYFQARSRNSLSWMQRSTAELLWKYAVFPSPDFGHRYTEL
jgi:hypothetical protein